MRILLTGACGLVGTAVRQAGAGEHTFVCLDTAEQVCQIGGIQGSFADREVIRRAAEGCDAIIHTAALHGSGRGKVPNDEYLRVNVIGAEYLFAAAVEHGVRRVVCSSTLEVLCGVDWSASGPRRYMQADPPRPDWAYPLSKLMVEQMGSLYHREHGLEVAQLRYAYVRHVPMSKIGYGLLARSVAVADVAAINLLCATSPHVRDEMFLVGAGSPIDEQDVIAWHRDPWSPVERHWPGASAVLQAAGTPPPLWDHLWPNADIEPARRALGWEPQATFTAWLRSLGWTPAVAASPNSVR